jgi:hypothetical protein
VAAQLAASEEGLSSMELVSETWSLTLREEHRLRVFENRVLRRIFGPKRDGVIGGWRELRNEELQNLYCFTYIVRACSTHGIQRFSLRTGRKETITASTCKWAGIVKRILRK